MELDKEQIRLLLHFQHKLGLKATKAAEQICDVYGDNVCSSRTAQNWFKTFREEGDRLTDKQRFSKRQKNADCVLGSNWCCSLGIARKRTKNESCSLL
jgi:transposase